MCVCVWVNAARIIPHQVRPRLAISMLALSAMFPNFCKCAPFKMLRMVTNQSKSVPSKSLYT